MAKPKKKRKDTVDSTEGHVQKLSNKFNTVKKSAGKKKTVVLSEKNIQMQDSLQPRPAGNQDISSNWKSFLQTAPESADPAAARRPRRPAGLARRGCTCSRAVWFDGVDPALLDAADRQLQLCSFCTRLQQQQRRRQLKSEQRETAASRELEALSAARAPQPSRCLAMDCEMVGVGLSGQDNMLARVSIVNALCQPVYDRFVRPKERVTDYRTAVSGVRPCDLVNGAEFETVQREVAELLKGRVLVGHAVHNDLRVLLLSHPKRHTRDTARYPPFRKMFNGRIPSLKNLAQRLLAVEIQRGEHDSVQDARATMQIYQTHRREWEAGEAHRLQERRRGGKTTA